ncbi:TPA: chemotaxis protein [Vibrio parahaemolyticus]|nr:virulence factor TspB C-terminal domain-related protein [Vibrio parahaemolyticus]HCG7206933.1 chemotaxis protein [Vibrio parahaemolyticus]HCG9059584.1 chemotaxis protein [Vibrio parahaemolyticus]
MNIKYLLTSLVILCSFSFSAFSQYLVIDREGNSASIAYRCTGYSRGDVVDTSNPPNVSGISWPDGSRNVACKSAYWVGSWLTVEFEYYGSKIAQIGGSYVSGCPDGKELNPATGKCEEPPVPFCEQQDTINQMNQFKDACFDKGWNPMVSCTDSTQSLDMTCNPPPEPDECTPDSSDWPACKDDEPKQCTPDSPDYPNCCDESNNWCDNPPPDSCTIFSPNWPACSGDTDIDPPTGGDLGDPDKPNGGGTGNPDPDKPEPDVEENSDTTKAIESMNKDLNKQLTGINNDLNKNHAENISHLDALKDSIDLNTDTIVDSSNHLKNAIESQTGTLSEIGNTNNKLLSSLNHLLNDGIVELSGDLKGIEGAINSGLDDLESGINGSINAGDCQSFSCEGNAATCYLAKQAWYESCQSKDLSEITEAGAGLLEGIGDYNDQFTDEHGAYKNIYENAEGSVGDLLQAYDESNGVNFDGECPAPKHYDGGLFKFTIDLAPFCEMAYIIRACIMAAAAFGSFMMISKFI